MHIDVGNHIHIRLVSHISIGAGIAVQSITTLYGVNKKMPLRSVSSKFGQVRARAKGVS